MTMAECNLSLHVIHESKVRPCFMGKRRCLFHRWEDRKDNTKQQVVAIVEWDDGSIHEAYPHEIRFADDWVDTIHDTLT